MAMLSVISGLSTTFLLLLSLLEGVSCATQVDLRLGASDFFLGEKFLITAFKRMLDEEERDGSGEELATNRVRGARLIGPKKYPTSLEQRMLMAIDTPPQNYFDGEDKEEDPTEERMRRGKLIGLRRLPTAMEEFALKDLSGGAEDNTSEEHITSGAMRQPRLIGPKKYPTQLEDRFLQPVSPEISNVFVEEN